MKSWNYMSVLVVCGLGVGVFAAAACGSDETGATGSGGGSAGASSSASVTASHSASSSSIASTGAGGEAPGDGICMSQASFDGDVLDGCLDANCCDSFTPCNADMDCAACLADPTGTGCDANAKYTAFKMCFDTSCPTAVCGTMLGYPSPNLNVCVHTNCCATFNPCEADMACNACLLDPTGAGCDMLMLYTDYKTCEDTNCPSDICGTGIIFASTYYNMSQDTVFDSNKCAATNCCTDLTACADPTGDGVLDMNDPEVDACLKCLQGDPACAAGPVKDSATAFDACFKAKCPQ